MTSKRVSAPFDLASEFEPDDAPTLIVNFANAISAPNDE